MTPTNSDRRKFNRAKGRGSALVIRDCDIMRTGIPGTLDDISHAGLSILLPTELKIGENLCIKLENPIQRTSVTARCYVRWVRQTGQGFRIGCSLLRWLTPQEVLTFRDHASRSTGKMPA